MVPCPINSLQMAIIFNIGKITHNPVEILNATLLFFTIHANGKSPNICKPPIRPSIIHPNIRKAIIIFQNDNDNTQLTGKTIAKYIIPV